MSHLHVFAYSTPTHLHDHTCYADRANGGKNAKSRQDTTLP